MEYAGLHPVAACAVELPFSSASLQIRRRYIGEWIKVDRPQHATDGIAGRTWNCVAMIEGTASRAGGRIQNAVEDWPAALICVEPTINEVAQETRALRIAVGDEPSRIVGTCIESARFVRIP